MTRGLFISFEGIDGAGKSTHIDRVAHLFRESGRVVVITREPGGTPLSEKLRELVLHEPMDALTEALLMFAARREHLVQVIEPALARGDVVLCDRFTDATFAYQGGGRGFDWQVLAQLERMVQTLPDDHLRQPELTVWFDLDPQIAAQRLATARVPDKFESQPADFFAAVRAGYAQRHAEMPQRFARIDAAQSREAVGLDVDRVVREWLKRVGS
ncbi:dTMP kinase [Limnohabitans sp. G3-2]|uniref:dTMP kinase n=1 Tax=Limnohabitans sp. G3-2 TaxID=1100711 RepID=UPI000C1DD5D5|nr:dTMP kinase [Limnohabitans sp. G3-2]PIT71852.1 dTMP kinase [Limnohabitans sp. G3-2]